MNNMMLMQHVNLWPGWECKICCDTCSEQNGWIFGIFHSLEDEYVYFLTHYLQHFRLRISSLLGCEVRQKKKKKKNGEREREREKEKGKGNLH